MYIYIGIYVYEYMCLTCVNVSYISIKYVDTRIPMQISICLYICIYEYIHVYICICL